MEEKKTTKKTIKKKKLPVKKKSEKYNPQLNQTFGRPTQYKPEYCQLILDYFDIKPSTDGIPCDIPFMTRFVRKELKVDYSTFLDWVEKHPDFAQSVNTCEKIVKEILITNSLNGLYQTKDFKFIAMNLTDMTDKSEVKHSGEMSIGSSLEEARKRIKENE